MDKNFKILLVFFCISSAVQITNAIPDGESPEGKTTSAVKSNLAYFEFKASRTNDEIAQISGVMIANHEFGESVSRKMYLLNSKYTFEVPVVPGNPQTKTVIRKPVIYEAVMKIERHLRKSYKNGEFTLDEASDKFSKTLDVANNILTADTREFEKTIKDNKRVEVLTVLFTQKVKLVF